MTTIDILKKLQSGNITVEQALEALNSATLVDLGHTKIDMQRQVRTGVAEVVFGQGKAPEQIVEIFEQFNKRSVGVLATRITSDAAKALKEKFANVEISDVARTAVLDNAPTEKIGKIAIVSAGTSDMPIVEEARICAEFFGNNVECFCDCGVAGLHRLIANIEKIRQAKVVIAIAGMEGALASVVAGLVRTPVIAVPTSVGYGANFEGLSALLSMINSCANGVSVVNIDNGFSAAYIASTINRQSK